MFLTKKIVFFIVFVLFLSNVFSSELDDYRVALSFYKDGFYELAEKNLSDFVENNKDSVFTKKALFFIALSRLNLKKYSDAIKNGLKARSSWIPGVALIIATIARTPYLPKNQERIAF